MGVGGGEGWAFISLRFINIFFHVSPSGSSRGDIPIEWAMSPFLPDVSRLIEASPLLAIDDIIVTGRLAWDKLAISATECY